MNRVFKFDYDNDGRGPHVSEITDAGGRPVHQCCYMDAAKLREYQAQGVREIFLTYRGSHTPADLIAPFQTQTPA